MPATEGIGKAAVTQITLPLDKVASFPQPEKPRQVYLDFILPLLLFSFSFSVKDQDSNNADNQGG